jgi:hypothetical protein
LILETRYDHLKEGDDILTGNETLLLAL